MDEQKEKAPEAKHSAQNEEEMLKLVRECYKILTKAGAECVISEKDIYTVNSPTVERALLAIVTPEGPTEGRKKKTSFFGEACPVNLGTPARQGMSPMRKAQSPSPVKQRNGCVLRDPDTWPDPTVDGVPMWAKNVQFFHSIPSPALLVREYCHGYPQPPSIRDVERVYGPGCKGVVKGDAWRFAPSKKKAFCCRKPLYELIEMHLQSPSGEEGAVKAIEEIVETDLGSYLTGSRTAREPGSTVMNKLYEVMKKRKAGFSERSEKARGRKRRKTEATSNTEDQDGES